MKELIISSSMSVCRGVCLEKRKRLDDLKIPHDNENYSEIMEEMKQQENRNDE